MEHWLVYKAIVEISNLVLCHWTHCQGATVYAAPVPAGVDFQPLLGTQTKLCSSLETPRQFQLTQLGFANSQQTERRYGCLAA